MVGSFNKRQRRKRKKKKLKSKRRKTWGKKTGGTPRDCNKMDLVQTKCGNRKKKRASLRYFISFFGDEERT